MTLPSVTATGNLTADPELRFTNNGKAVASFTVACNDRRKDATGNWIDGDTTFLTCQAWDEQAEQITEQLSKGQRVTVAGKLRQRSYEAKDGSKRTVYEVTNPQVTVALARASRPTQEQAPF